MIDVSGFGTSVVILSTASFPVGFSVTQFAHDKKPLIVDTTRPIGSVELYDGSLFFFNKTAPIRIHIAVIAGSDDDMNMKIMLQSRKSAVKIIPLPDVTTMTITYGDGGRVMLANGSIIEGPLADTISQDGQRESNTYTFEFGSFAGAQSAKELISTIANIGFSLL